jgi:hypothetical protein
MAVYTTIDNPELYFQVKTYAGNGSNPRTITLDGDEDMQPDLVWQKNRTDSNGHTLADAVRGANKTLSADGTATEITDKNDGHLDAFTSDGFTVGAGSSSDARVNDGSHTYVAWCWKESATAGFDIITYSGTGSNIDLSHNLSAVPDFFTIKNRDVDQAWRVYHKNMTTADPYSNRMVFSESGAQSTSALGLDADPTSSVINIGTGTGCTNASGEDFVCYAWKEIQGYSKFGSYSGNGNANAPFVYTGFKPAFVLIKSTASGVWRVWDNKRDALNPNTANFQPNAADAEYDHSSVAIDFLSSGFKPRSTDSSFNGSGTSNVYMAFAEAPFVNSNGVPCNAR